MEAAEISLLDIEPWYPAGVLRAFGMASNGYLLLNNHLAIAFIQLFDISRMARTEDIRCNHSLVRGNSKTNQRFSVVSKSPGAHAGSVHHLPYQPGRPTP